MTLTESQCISRDSLSISLHASLFLSHSLWLPLLHSLSPGSVMLKGLDGSLCTGIWLHISIERYQGMADGGSVISSINLILY